MPEYTSLGRRVDVAATARPSVAGHFEIARLDHWIKNLFVLPGFVAALAIDPAVDPTHLWLRMGLALLAVGLVASGNYSINEVLDARYDRHHPTKRFRAVPMGKVHLPLAYAQWIGLAAIGVVIGWYGVSQAFAGVLLVFWGMGLIYNVPPARIKDVPFLDVLVEAINNPLRMLAGWYALSLAIPPLSLLLAYWMIGCYFMAIKRFAEVRHIGDPRRVAAYRRSLAAVSERRLLITVMFYSAVGMLFLGAFIMRYRLELIVSFPAIAVVMAIYFNLAFDDDSAAQHPEKLYREQRLVAAIALCALVLIVTFFVDLPLLHRLFEPTVPAVLGGR